ncbi:hypothetical protein ABGV43_03920 [Paenibacillus amylolyticus]|uniref:hypothetical protein n=1 Tax=Paenibacillus amylolyticus TaxID=1451 RepID=UPI003242916B
MSALFVFVGDLVQLVSSVELGEGRRRLRGSRRELEKIKVGRFRVGSEPGCSKRARCVGNRNGSTGMGNVMSGNSDVGRDVGVDQPSSSNEPETPYSW